jgi:hypothetical protein
MHLKVITEWRFLYLHRGPPVYRKKSVILHNFFRCILSQFLDNFDNLTRRARKFWIRSVYFLLKAINVKTTKIRFLCKVPLPSINFMLIKEVTAFINKINHSVWTQCRHVAQSSNFIGIQTYCIRVKKTRRFLRFSKERSDAVCTVRI